MAASNLYLGKASGGVLNIQPADGTTNTSLVLPAVNGTVVAADSNGNVGIGITPYAWHTSAKAIDIGGKSTFGFLSSSTDYTLIYHNSYVNQSGFDIYKQNGYASSLIQNDGKFTWRTAPNGTAGNTITWTNAMTLDSNGNLGIGVTPSAWYSGVKAQQIGSQGSIFQDQNNNVGIGKNTYKSGANTYNYNTNDYASLYYQSQGQHQWYTAPSGTAGNAITWTNAMVLDASGDLTLGQSIFRRSVTGLLSEGLDVLNLYQPVGYNTRLSIVNGASPNVANAGFLIARNSVTLRSINAGGTINASGADYAEYEYSNDITLVKGQIVGFKEDGTLTDRYSESIRFAIKSTNPSIVGGDVWGCEEIVGKRPEQPVKTEEMTDEEFAKLEEQYEKDLVDFEARLEAERQKVDRIAYAGKVPVNVYGAVAGQYVIAIEKEDGTIDGKLVNKVDMTFAEYQDAVGRVNKILDDGRAEVAVIIH